jgi:hypothetical protein
MLPDSQPLGAAIGAGRWGQAAGLLAPLWCCAVPVVALWRGFRRDRQDRMQGGQRERRATAAAGPIAVWRRRRAHAAPGATDRHHQDGLRVGVDEAGLPVRVALPRAHVTIVGGSNTGKTNTAQILLEGQVAAGGGFIVIDGKGGTDLPHHALTLGRRFERPVALWSITGFADPALERQRTTWNPLGDATPTEVKDRIAAAEPQTEPYYAAVAARGLLIAAATIAAGRQPIRLDRLSALLDDPTTLATALPHTLPGAHIEARWLASLDPGERSALRGAAVRLRTMVASDGGPALLPSPREIQLLRAMRERWLVVFSLPQGLYPALVPQVTRYLLAALSSACARIENTATPSNAMVFVDELSAFDGDQLASGLERGRSAGVRYILATQSLSNLRSAGDTKLHDAALDNAELVVIHRQATPDAVELLASLAGTEDHWQHTHQTLPTGDSGLGSRRLTDRYIAHPNTIRRLPTGHAILITHRPTFTVQHVHIDHAT